MLFRSTSEVYDNGLRSLLFDICQSVEKLFVGRLPEFVYGYIANLRRNHITYIDAAHGHFAPCYYVIGDFLRAATNDAEFYLRALIASECAS